MAEELITLKNNNLTVTVSTMGAELHSVMRGGTEYLWNGDPNVWAGRAPLLFPICGGLKDDKYTFEGQEYTLNKHGYVRFCEFETESTGEESAVFLLKSNSESKKSFPFDYELRVAYTLDGAALKVDYSVLNRSDTDMYFSIGAHEGYMCPEGIEEYRLEFEKNERLTTNILNGNLLTEEYTLLGEDVNSLDLKYEYFMIDALTFLNLKSRSITLCRKSGGAKVRVDFDGFDYLFVWTKPGAKYICIEPWCGIPDFEGTGYDLTQKRGINRLARGDVFKRTHTVTFL